MVGTGTGRQTRGAVQNATALETSARIDTVVMDKTGTPDQRRTGGHRLLTDGIGEDELLGLGAPRWRENPNTRWRRRSCVMPPAGA